MNEINSNKNIEAITKMIKEVFKNDLRINNKEFDELCERMATVTYRATGGRLSYSNYTLDAIEQAFNDQLDILSDKKLEPYIKTLQEIKEIAEDMCKKCFEIAKFIKPDDCGICDYLKILQKISEVE